MFITNLEDAVALLRPKLRDYLEIKLDIDPNAKKIHCFAHKDSNPSMHFNPKVNDEIVVCFACGWKGDIFAAASHLDGLPERGPEWVTETIPHLAKMLSIPISVGPPSPKEKERIEAFKLTRDIADILSTYTKASRDYLEQRKWTAPELVIGSISKEDLVNELIQKGYTAFELKTKGIIESSNHDYFGEDKITVVINDHRGRPVGFVSRNRHDMPKYLNTPETLIYEKRKVLLGLDVALSHGRAKQNGITLVEGPGDLLQMYRLGIYNAAAICGTALTKNHLELIKMLGVHQVSLALDWDEAGILATQRILREELSGITGLSINIVSPPNDNDKDMDSYLFNFDSREAFDKLQTVTGFEWLVSRVSKNQDPVDVCLQLVPSIASEGSAIRREQLSKILADYTGLSIFSILQDVDSIRYSHEKEKQERIKTALVRYTREVEKDPSNILACKARHEEELDEIYKDYQKDSIGVNYQLARYDAMQERHRNKIDGTRTSGFKFNHFKIFGDAFSDGMDLSTGVLIYLAGRANSGKTATGLALVTDVLLSDPDTIVCCHFTDDSYNQIEPRVKTNIAYMANEGRFPIKLFANPKEYSNSKESLATFLKTSEVFRKFLAEERLVIIDSEDGKTLSVLEMNIKLIRQKHPDKKLLVFIDSTYNYNDFEHLDQRGRISRISDMQKLFATKYDCCVIATAEYRKNMPQDQTKMKLPVDDDIADARELQYRASIIIHVYNDLHDRRDAAEVYHGSKENPKPRLMLVVSKNKIGNCKDTLILDLDTESVTLSETPKDIAKLQWAAHLESVNGEDVHGYEVETDWDN